MERQHFEAAKLGRKNWLACTCIKRKVEILFIIFYLLSFKTL
jgi:hypothetical protein